MQKERQTQPHPLSGRGLDNIIAFTQLLGYVRHFHPSDQAASVDWNSLAIDGLRRVEACNDARSLARALQEFVKVTAPTVQVSATGEMPSPATVEPADTSALSVVHWWHFGVCQGVDEDKVRLSPHGRSLYQSERIFMPASDPALAQHAPNPLPPFEAELAGGVSCRVPLAVYADDGGTLPHGPGEPVSAASSLHADDRATRLAAVCIAWNILHHFYPYFDVVVTDWGACLRAALEAAATDADADAFTRTLQRLIAGLRDGHGDVRSKSDPALRALPLAWTWTEDSLVITEVAAEAANVGLAPGDLVTEIDGKLIGQHFADLEQRISAATPQWLRCQTLRRLSRGPEGSEVRLKSTRGGADRGEVQLSRNHPLDALSENRLPVLAEVASGVLYHDILRASDDDIRAAIPRLAEAKCIIFDLRGYPQGRAGYAYFAHLIDQPIRSARWTVPIVTRPDRQDMSFTDGEYGRWTIEPAAPRFTGRVAFLTDGRAISYAESCMGIVEAYKLGEIVGEATAGTNGNVNFHVLPGGYTIYWTGMRVLKHDGSQHHGIGIRPTVHAGRTIQGIAEGRDEVLEKAIAVISW